MKKQITIIAIALLVSAFTAVKAEDIKKPELYTRPLSVGAYQVGNSMTINMMIEKRLGQKATIKVLDADKNVLYTQTTGKNDASYKFSFDMSELPVGSYSIETTTGTEKVTKEVERGIRTLSY